MNAEQRLARLKELHELILEVKVLTSELINDGVPLATDPKRQELDILNQLQKDIERNHLRFDTVLLAHMSAEKEPDTPKNACTPKQCGNCNPEHRHTCKCVCHYYNRNSN